MRLWKKKEAKEELRPLDHTIHHLTEKEKDMRRRLVQLEREAGLYAVRSVRE